jgi:predicted SPOUT superfamily RNA methylase MTH1
VEKKRLVIAIPASIISDTPHLREKTAKIGLIGRAAAIFRVEEIIVYRDSPKEKQTADLDLISTLLSYMETPQYLRKRLFKIEPRLQFAGIMPPLRTPHHPAKRSARSLRVGEYVEGLVLSQAKEGVLIDIGVESPVLLRDKQHAIDERLTLQIVRTGDHVEVQVASREDVPDYWGFVVTIERGSLREAIEHVKPDSDTILGPRRPLL